MSRFPKLGTSLNPDFRNSYNKGVDKIDEELNKWQTEFNNVVETVSNEAFNQVVDNAKIEWLPPVNTFADLAISYPDVTEGKASMARDSGKVYRFNGTEWIEIQEIDPNAINEVDSRLSEQLAQTVQQTKNQSFLLETKTGIIAHRGAHLNAPENTIKAIYNAGVLGYEMVELDVQKTADGVYMLMHDSSIDRTTDGTGTFKNMSFVDVQNLIVDESYYGKSEEEVIRVPTFEEACQECQKWGLGINVDGSKMTYTEEVIIDIVEMLKRYNLFEKSFFVLDDSSARFRLTNLYPNANVTWLTSATDPTNNINECKKYRNAFVTYPQSSMTDTLISAYKRENIPIFVHSANNIRDVYKFVTKGVRFIETDTILPGGEF